MPDRPRPRPNNGGASVRQRLLNLAHACGQPTELLLTRNALERLLYRLSLSLHRERFVLKGAMLLAIWFDEPHRATPDADLFGFGNTAEDAPLATFREIMALEVDDGVNFDLKGLHIEAVRDEVEDGGSRLHTTATLAGAAACSESARQSRSPTAAARQACGRGFPRLHRPGYVAYSLVYQFALQSL